MIVITMPSLPVLPSTEAKAMPSGDASRSSKYREVAYHLDGRSRYVAQSYEVRSSSHTSLPTSSLRTQHPQPATISFSSSCNNFAMPRSLKAGKENAVVVIQSRETSEQGPPDDNARGAEASRLKELPPTPRPRRLSTPELPDMKDRQFCYCDSRKNCAEASCQRALL